MIYQFAHIVKERFPFVWEVIEKVNEWLFLLRYRKKLKSISIKSVPEGYMIIALKDVAVETMVNFFNHQPKEAFTYFHPHNFDAKTIKKLQKNRSFLSYVMFDINVNRVVGYCFNRCFFMGKGFRGRMVDIDFRGKGLGTAMNVILNEVGFGIGLRLFETVSKNNTASYRSAISASKVKVIKEKQTNELYLEVLPK